MEISSGVAAKGCRAVAKHLTEQGAIEVPDETLPLVLAGLAEGMELIKAMPAGAFSLGVHKPIFEARVQ